MTNKDHISRQSCDGCPYRATISCNTCPVRLKSSSTSMAHEPNKDIPGRSEGLIKIALAKLLKNLEKLCGEGYTDGRVQLVKDMINSADKLYNEWLKDKEVQNGE